MRSWIWALAALIGLIPTTASATLQLVMERGDHIPNGQEQILLMDVFLVDLDNTNEQLVAWTVAVDAPLFSPGGVHFLPPQLPRAHPYVFQAFPGSEPENFASTENRLQVGAGLAGSTAQVNVVNGTNDGLFTIPVFVPANPAPGLYPLAFDPTTIDFAGAGAPNIIVVGQPGFLIIWPEPSVAALTAVASVALLRRRRRPHDAALN